MAEEKRKPWFKFFPDNWRADALLKDVSLAARGLWIEMLLLMDSSPRRGFLVRRNGLPLTDADIANKIGAPVGEVARCSQELKDAGVYSLENRRIIYSRKMVRDTKLSESKAIGGRAKADRTPDAHANAPPNAPASSGIWPLVPDLSLPEQEDASAPGPPRFDLHRLGRIKGLSTPHEQLADAIRAVFGLEKARLLHDAQITNFDRMIADYGVDDVYAFCAPRIGLGTPFGKVRDEFWEFYRADAKRKSGGNTGGNRAKERRAERDRREFSEDGLPPPVNQV